MLQHTLERLYLCSMKQLTLLLAFVLLASCHTNKGKDPAAPAHRGIYHWKTTYNPSQWERDWMKEHKIDRLYVKLFDVEPGAKHGYDDWSMVPVATTSFRQKLPKELDVVPVVYITVEAIRALEQSSDYNLSSRYAEMMVTRIERMMAEHWGGTLKEVQFDCDWTWNTRDVYFMLCQRVKSILHEKGIRLSGTLRLHQLSQVGYDYESEDDEIPFDRSLLMCYNTGRIGDANIKNSILDFNDVTPYLKRYKKDFLPCCDVAYPVYGWGVAFDEEGYFVRLINSHTLAEGNAWKEAPVRQAAIREDWGEAEDIVKTQTALPMLDNKHTTILFHLDSLNLSKYSHEEIETFYSR